MASDMDGKVCDVKGCNNQATEGIPAQNAEDISRLTCAYYTLASIGQKRV